MSDTGKHITTYSASDIQRYLKGEMSAREMHHLEKAALDDPFLADALEGFETQQTPDTDLDQLHNRFNTRITQPAGPKAAAKKRIIPLSPWLRIAAAVILLIGLGLTAWFTLLNGHQQKEIVANTVRQTGPAAVSDSVAAKIPAPDPMSASAPDSERSVAASTPALTAKKSRSTSIQPTGTPPAPDSILSSAYADVQTRGSGNERYKLESVTLRNTSPAFDSTTIVVTNPMSFSGRVLDATNNSPLSGAVLQWTGNNRIGTVTDEQGRFNLKVPKDSATGVTIGAVGYEPASLVLNELKTELAKGNVIHLQQQHNALDEVVVVGYGAKRKETRALAPAPTYEKMDSLWETVTPVMGKQAYLDYLTTGKKTIGADSSIKGTVVISFNVNKKGSLSSFKVEQSLTPAHDAGILRLVSEGPAWKVTKGRSGRAVVRVVF